MACSLTYNIVHRLFAKQIFRKPKPVMRINTMQKRTSLRRKLVWGPTNLLDVILCAAILCAAILICIYWKAFVNFCREAIRERDFYSPGSSTIKYPLENKFLTTNKRFCHIHRPYLLIMVPSRTKNFDVRQAIRETYGSISRDKIPEVGSRKVDVVIRTLFVVGTSTNRTLQEDVMFESRKHRDILQVDIIDSYYNLTAKLLHALKWINANCNHVTYILKADEDVFVNVGVLLEQLNMTTLSERGNVFGKIYNSGKHLDVLRDGKWAVTQEEYPLEKYPPYAQGTSYTLTRNLVTKVIHTAQFFPYFHIEDVFITGIIAGRMHGAELIRLNKTSDWGDPVPNPCKFAKNGRLSQHRMTPHLMRQTWKALMSFTLTCRTYRGRTMIH